MNTRRTLACLVALALALPATARTPARYLPQGIGLRLGELPGTADARLLRAYLAVQVCRPRDRACHAAVAVGPSAAVSGWLAADDGEHRLDRLAVILLAYPGVPAALDLAATDSELMLACQVPGGAGRWGFASVDECLDALDCGP